MDFEELNKKGYELLHEGDIDAALDLSREMQKEDSVAPEGYVLEAEVMQKLNQWDESIKKLDIAIKLEPNIARFYNLRGFSHLQKEVAEAAQADFKQAIQLEDLPGAHRNLVLCMILEERGNEALDYLVGRIRKDPSDVENWILMGDIMKKGGREDKARTYYEQALKMDPENEYAQKQLEE